MGEGSGSETDEEGQGCVGGCVSAVKKLPTWKKAVCCGALALAACGGGTAAFFLAQNNQQTPAKTRASLLATRSYPQYETGIGHASMISTPGAGAPGQKKYKTVKFPKNISGSQKAAFGEPY